MENKTENKIKVLRTDNGNEYESKEFNEFCREVGTKRETTAAYKLEKNGVAERKKRTIVEVSHAMQCEKGFPKFLWGEAANTAVYV